MSAIPPADVNPHGLHQRYRVEKLNGQPIDHLATYFVLRLDGFGKDGCHVSACRAAAMAYADHVERIGATHLAKVAADLRALVENFDRNRC